MIKKPISPKTHILLDYALLGSLLTIPSIMGFNKKVKAIYTTEALILLAYVAITDSPLAVKPLIPFPLHGRIDPVNMCQFALQSLFKPFRKDKKALIFNIGFTLATGVAVLLTDWNGPTKTSKLIA